MGRRVQKVVYAYSAGAWVQQKELLFVYDGWNVIEEITRQGGSDTSRYFVWGLDLSQSLQGAGGVGGLLAMVDDGNTYHYCFDANGNVSQLVNAANSEIVAHYEFDPFGNVVLQSGSMADANPFRFSTKYFDDETGLGYWGYRYYAPELGRWINRDPIEEKGGGNLYTFVQNNSINAIDLNGLKSLIDYLEERMLYYYNNHGKQVGSQCPIQLGLEQTNCIIYCSSVIEWAYAKVGKKEIAKTIAQKSKKGTELAKYLQSIGWKGIYWNPDVKNPFDGDNEHSYSYTIAKNKKRYYGIPVSGYVVNYRPTEFYKNDPPWWKVWESRELDESRMTTKDLSGLEKLKKVRFGFGAARGGRHTFLYGSGSIYEVHWGGISILGLYEKSPFENYGWLSGILMVPPGNGVY